MEIRDRQNFLAGSLFAGIGAVFAIVAARYPLGTADSMGPGFLPLVLGLVVFVFGVGMAITSALPLRGASRVAWPKFEWRPILYVCLPVILFGLFLSQLGIAVCVFGAVALSSLAREDFSISSMVAVATVLSTICVLLFGWVLDLPIPVWPTIFTR